MKKNKLKILVISNLYPPNYIGGYELFCKDIVDGLIKKGHDIHVLTSTFKYSDKEAYIRRTLHLIGSFEKGEKSKINSDQLNEIKISDQNEIKKELFLFRPDIIYVWHMANLHKNLMNTLIESQIPIVYHFEDRWIPSFYYEMFSYFLGFRISYVKYLSHEIWSFKDFRTILVKLIKRVKRLAEKESRAPKDPLPKPDIKKSIFLSKSLMLEHKKLGFKTIGSVVIYNGINIEKFKLTKTRRFPVGSPKILFVGRIAEKKGIQTLIKALGEIKKENYQPTLTIVGETDDHSFKSTLKAMTTRFNIENQVMFAGSVDRSEIPKYYHSHDILVFPSIWEEPFGLVLIEAMCAKLPIISTRTGGTKEFLKDNYNCLIFKPADYKMLASLIKKLSDSKKKYVRLSKNSYEFVRKKFNLNTSIDKIEQYLYKSLQ